MKDRLLWARIDDTGASGDGAEAVVPWWSVTKTAIAATALRLAAAGRLDLDAGLPEGPFSLRRLLRHEARLPDYGTFPPYAAAVARGLDPWPPEELLARAAALPAPTAWTYSNIGYLLARRALERSQGAPLGTLVAEWLLAPLGLARPRLAETRADMEAAALPSPGYHPGWVYHGCLLGPVADAAALLHGILAGPLLTPEDRAALCNPTPVGGPLPGRPWRSTGYGLGLMVGEMQGSYGPVAALGHSAGGPGSGGATYRFPTLPGAPVVAVFGRGVATDACEWRAVGLAET
jgi:D-alanyl-D-alanine carboxypeptidase